MSLPALYPRLLERCLALVPSITASTQILVVPHPRAKQDECRQRPTRDRSLQVDERRVYLDVYGVTEGTRASLDTRSQHARGLVR
ncbi:hypothetical protein C8Q77DRAFT_1108653 [Trametes polyzona]|nr:hypothetical protein C8Q77DRAFT_1108653 [Trametes polyzona]